MFLNYEEHVRTCLACSVMSYGELCTIHGCADLRFILFREYMVVMIIG